MTKNVLILEKGDLYCRQLFNLVKLELKGADIKFAKIEDIGALFEKIRLDSWDLIVINFDVPSLSRMSIPNIEAFMNEAKQILLGCECKVVGVTGSSELSQTLFRLGVMPRQKEYTSTSLKGLLGSVVKKVVIKEIPEISGTEVGRIQSAVSEVFGISAYAMKSPSRRTRVVEARYAAMYLAKFFTKLSLKEIGESFGGRDHSSVLYGVETAKEKMRNNATFKERVEALTQKNLNLRASK